MLAECVAPRGHAFWNYWVEQLLRPAADFEISLADVVHVAAALRGVHVVLLEVFDGWRP